VRRASLQAVARAYGVPQPTPEECDGARWESGLVGAYLSLPRRVHAAVPDVSASAPAYRPPFGWLALVAPAALALTQWVAPATALWETRGHVSPGLVLGVPNAPESVLFLLLARVWTVLLSPLLSLDVALTLLALALAGALASVSFLLVHRVLWRVGWTRPAVAGAGFAALGVAVALGYWGAVRPTGSAYVMSGTLLIAAGWMFARCGDRMPEQNRARYLRSGAYLLALAVAGPVLWMLPLVCAPLLALRFASGLSERL
jgi:hypothetical protein